MESWQSSPFPVEWGPFMLDVSGLKKAAGLGMRVSINHCYLGSMIWHNVRILQLFNLFTYNGDHSNYHKEKLREDLQTWKWTTQEHCCHLQL